MRPPTLALAGLLLMSSCGLLPGTRLFEVEYRVDSELVLAGAYEERDSVPVRELWGSLAEPPMWVEAGSPTLTPDPADPRKAVLSGEVEVRLVHADRPLSAATLDELRLVRDDATSNLWHPDAAALKELSTSATY